MIRQPAPIRFLSTLSLRRATRHCFLQQVAGKISIHALLAESDLLEWDPRGVAALFLSTLSLRRATLCLSCTGALILYFYPRSPCGERLCVVGELEIYQHISIHALLAESDSNRADGSIGIVNFYPRSPCGERHQ